MKKRRVTSQPQLKNDMLVVHKKNIEDKVIAFAGNPNVGKSTIFNRLTGMKQHTGNWPGKTVETAQGHYSYEETDYVCVDLPGSYSLMAHSAEEEVARDFICFGQADAIVVVCDATCLERNMNFVLQILEVTSKVVLCVNLIDEAYKKHIQINISKLKEKLGIPVIATSARNGQGIKEIFLHINQVLKSNGEDKILTIYPDYIEEVVFELENYVKEIYPEGNARWISLQLLLDNESFMQAMQRYLKYEEKKEKQFFEVLHKAKKGFKEKEITEEQVKDHIAASFIDTAEEICKDAIYFGQEDYNKKDRLLDRIFTSRLTGFPIMIFLLLFIFWITIVGANYPSELISKGLFYIEEKLLELFAWMSVPKLCSDILILGIYRVLAWVVSVMLPPMAIFFSLFTLLEDFGYLPRVAFNVDKCFKKCNTCGKQALTMCMGFGCNAAGIAGCRIIDSPRERLIAMITNNFVPCNGRFPILIAIISMFFVGSMRGMKASIFSAVLLFAIISLGIFMTFVVSKILSKTILKGIPSSFTLELPPYRRPQIKKVVIRSILDRTLFVLGRAIISAIPIGFLIWILANISVENVTLLAHCSAFLDPFARSLGLDGVILLAFILGLPANEIVVPIIIMTYMAQGNLMEFQSLSDLKELLVQNGWTWITAVSTMLFALMHWPCATSCLTLKKESGSLKWTAIAMLIPSLSGILICFVFSHMARLFL